VNVLLAGVSTRAIAASAARAGFGVTAIDAFADLDQHPDVRALSLGDRFSPDAAARQAETIASDSVAYGASFENHPGAITAIARGRALWGNPSDVIRRVRDPKLLSQALHCRGLAAPHVWEPVSDDEPAESRIPNPDSPRAWLVKRRASGGGYGIRRWHRGMRVPRGSHLQEFVEGVPGSIVFVASAGRAVPIGLTRQLVGDEAFGVSGYRYCGNILTASGEDDDVVTSACAAATGVCEDFGLVGVNGIDIVVKNGAPYAIEVNPRWCASMELVERAYGLSVFGVHAAACRDGVVPHFDLAEARNGALATGKAIVFARRDVSVGDTREWLFANDDSAADIHDVPKPGTRIRAGHPVCTVFATAIDSAACRAELVRRARTVHAALNAML
jgi:predicted ATP-grasp superfamily ATP-dependent carboligase